jgi:flagellar protein FliS
MLQGQHDTYQAVQATTADPGRVVIMLFDGAERFLRQAQQGLDRGDIAAFSYMLSRAHAIVGELSNAVDREAGGEVAQNLARLYTFMLLHLSQGLIAKSRVHLEQVLGPLKQLREGFEAALQIARREPA